MPLPSLRSQPYCCNRQNLHRYGDPANPDKLAVFPTGDIRGIQIALSQGPRLAQLAIYGYPPAPASSMASRSRPSLSNRPPSSPPTPCAPSRNPPASTSPSRRPSANLRSTVITAPSGQPASSTKIPPKRNRKKPGGRSRRKLPPETHNRRRPKLLRPNHRRSG